MAMDVFSSMMDNHEVKNTTTSKEEVRILNKTNKKSICIVM
jgi:hypothetical protein